MKKEDHLKNNIGNTDEIMSKKKDDSLSYLDKWDIDSFSFTDFLAISSILDFISPKNMTDEYCGNSLHNSNNDECSIKPYVKINDLNNSKDEPYLNKPKPAIEIGIEFDF